MKNHFLISYAGNKRTEVEILYNQIINKLDEVETIIEPFCGTSAFSYYISTKHPKKFKYILNDNNKNLIDLYKIASDENKFKEFIIEVNEILKDITKEKYDNLDVKNLIGWFITHKIYCIHPGIFPSDEKRIKRYINNLIDCTIINFLRNEDIIFLNEDAINVMNNYKDNDKNLIFIDPPYIKSCNDFYLNTNMNIYEYLYNNKIDLQKAIILLCLEDNWIIKLLFVNNIVNQYNKLYQQTKKKTSHLIIHN